MPDLSSAFNKRNLRLGLAGVLASVSLAGMSAPAHAQEATPTPTATTTTAAPAASNGQPANGTTLDRNSCMETTTNNKRNNFLIFGNSRSSSTSVYNAQCGDDRVQEYAIITMLTAVRADGSPDIPMRALAIQMYRQRDDESRQRVDAMMAAQGIEMQDVIMSITPTGSAAVCVRQPAPAATAGTPVRVSVSFRCTAPGATTTPTTTAPAAAAPAAADGTATSTTDTSGPVIGTPDVTGTTVASVAAPAAPAPRP